MHFKEWFEKKIRKIQQIPKAEKEKIHNISPSSDAVFKKKEANEEILSEDDNNTIASYHNNTIPEATKFQSISVK
jgi:hypothetical protein